MPSRGAARPLQGTLKQHLVLLVVAALLPMVLLAVGLTASLVNRQKAEVEQRLVDNARSLARAVDVELQRTIAALQTLALDESLLAGDLRSFHRKAGRARDAVGVWTSVLVLGPDGQHLMNLLRPYGEPLPPLGQPGEIVATAQTRMPRVSNFLVGATSRVPQMYVTYPVVIDGEVRYVLEATIPSRYWSDWLAQRAPEGATTSLVDGQRTILARSRDADQLVGRPVQPWFAELLAREADGIARGEGVASGDVLVAYARTALAPWHVNVLVSGRVAADQPVRDATVRLAAGALATLALALALALWRARVLARGIDAIREAVGRMGAQTPLPPVPASRVRELDEAIHAVDDAARTLARRARRIAALRRSLRQRMDTAETAVRQLQDTEARLRLANQELAAVGRRKDEFIATLAHELRNPLAPMRSAVDLLQLQDREPGRRGQPGQQEQPRQPGHPADPGDARRARVHDVLDRQVRLMTRLVDDLLEVSRIKRGTIQLQLADVDLVTVATAAVEATAPQVARAQVTLDVALSPEPLWVRGDATRLVQVVVNLLANAAKFTPPHGRIQVQAWGVDGHATIEVRDDGIGIEPAHLPWVFEMFSQVAPAIDRFGSGLGIGLALVRGVVRAHGGEVEARSDGPGRGSTFVVTLPRVKPAAPSPVPAPPAAASAAAEAAASGAQPAQDSPAPRAERAPSESMETGPGDGSLRIVVADDNVDAADTLAQMLRLMGHEVAVAHDGAAAVAVAAGRHPDLMLLDIGMPLMNGYEAARQVRAQPWGRGVRLVAVTGWGQQHDRQAAREAGFDEHLTKPVDTAVLHRVIDEVVRGAPSPVG